MDLETILVKRLLVKKMEETAFTDVVTAAQAMTDAEKAQFATTLMNGGNPCEPLAEKIKEALLADAKTETDTILSSSTMTVQQLIALLV